MAAADTHRAITAVWRIESARLIAGLARIVRGVGLAEDLAQDALVIALERWPESGIPDNPGAWLMATAKHRAIDLLRRRKLLDRKHEELGREVESRRDAVSSDLDAALDDEVGDDLLRLVFTACQAGPRRGARRLRGSPREGAGLPLLVGAPGHLPHLQRSLRGHRGRRLGATCSLRGRASPGPHPGRAGATGAGGPRPRGAHGDPGVTLDRPGRPLGRAHPAARPGPLALGQLLIRRGLSALERAEGLGGLLPSVRGDLLARLGRFDEARPEFERAASLTANARERRLLLERAAACAHGRSPQPRS